MIVKVSETRYVNLRNIVDVQFVEGPYGVSAVATVPAISYGSSKPAQINFSEAEAAALKAALQDADDCLSRLMEDDYEAAGEQLPVPEAVVDQKPTGTPLGWSLGKERYGDCGKIRERE